MSGQPIWSGSQTERGFTLLELLIVLVLIALAATVGQLMVRGGGGMELRTAARGVARDLRTLKQQAVRRQTAMSILVKTTEGQALVGDETSTLKLPTDLNLSYDPGPAAIVDQPSNRLIFFPDGSSTGGSITLRRGSTAIRVRIAELDGEVKVND